MKTVEDQVHRAIYSFDVIGGAGKLNTTKPWANRGTLYSKNHKKSISSCRSDLELCDDLGDVGVHLVELGLLGGLLPVLAAGHGVHDVLSVGKDERVCLTVDLTWMRAR